MRNPVFCICENKGADQLHCDRASHQRLSFCNPSTSYLFEISSLYPSAVVVQPGLCSDAAQLLRVVIGVGGYGGQVLLLLVFRGSMYLHFLWRGGGGQAKFG